MNPVPPKAISKSPRVTSESTRLQEITTVGDLELKTPPWANEMHEYPYLPWNMEVHQARLRAVYPHAADKIGSPVATGHTMSTGSRFSASSSGRGHSSRSCATCPSGSSRHASYFTASVRSNYSKSSKHRKRFSATVAVQRAAPRAAA